MPVVVVLPLVPVTPMSVSRRPGCPYQAWPSTSAARRPSRTTISGTPRLLRRLSTTAAPPRGAPRRRRSGGRRPASRARRRRACRDGRCGCPCRRRRARAPPAARRRAGRRGGARPGARARPATSGRHLLTHRLKQSAPIIPPHQHGAPRPRVLRRAAGHGSHHPPEPAQVHPEPAPVQRQRRLADRRARRRRAPAGAAVPIAGARYGRVTTTGGGPAGAAASGFGRLGHRGVVRGEAAAVDRHPARGERLLQHRARDRCGREPAVVVAPRVVDLHDHHELRIIGREDRREGRRVFAAHVVAVLRTGRPCRSSRAPSSWPAAPSSPVPPCPDRFAQELAQLRRDLGRHHPPHRLGRVPIEHIARRVPHLAHQRGREQDAVVRDGPVRRRQLHRRHPELVAHRHAGAGVLRLPPIRAAPGSTARLARELRTGRRAEAEVPQRLELLLGPEARGELRHGDVARHLDGAAPA